MKRLIAFSGLTGLLGCLGALLFSFALSAFVVWLVGVVLYDGVIAPYFGWRTVPFWVLFAVLYAGSVTLSLLASALKR